MKILVVDGQRTVGGGQMMTLATLRALHEAGHEVAAAIPDGDSDLSRLLAEFTQFGYPHKEYSRGRKSVNDVAKFVGNFIEARRFLRKIIQEWRPSIVQILNSIPIPYVAAATQTVPVGAHIHVFHSDAKSRMLLDLAIGRKNVRYVMAPTAYTLSQLSPRLRSKFRVVPNFVERQPNVRPRELPQKGVPTVAMVGDVCPQKGQHVVMEAMEGLNFEARLRIAGPVVDQAYRDSLENRHAALPHIFAGRVENTARWLHDSDLLVSASESETFCLSMVEAWSVAVPTLASRGSGTEELIRGFFPPNLAEAMLFDRGDRDELTSKMADMLSDRHLYAAVSARALDASRRMDAKAFATNLVSIINEYP